jgi:hypothetical protein
VKLSHFPAAYHHASLCFRQGKFVLIRVVRPRIAWGFLIPDRTRIPAAACSLDLGQPQCRCLVRSRAELGRRLP